MAARGRGVLALLAIRIACGAEITGPLLPRTAGAASTASSATLRREIAGRRLLLMARVTDRRTAETFSRSWESGRRGCSRFFNDMYIAQSGAKSPGSSIKGSVDPGIKIFREGGTCRCRRSAKRAHSGLRQTRGVMGAGRIVWGLFGKRAPAAFASAPATAPAASRIFLLSLAHCHYAVRRK